MSEDTNASAPTQEMANWLRLLGMKQLMAVLESDVNDDKKKMVYQNSDGQKTTRDIGTLIGVSFKTVSEWWKKWVLLGLGEYMTASGGHRFKRAFNLESLGLLPAQKSKEKSDKKTSEKDGE